MRALAVAAGISLLLTGSAFAAETVSVGPFQGIELRGGGHVRLVHGAEQRVTILNGSTQFTKIAVYDGNSLRIDACSKNCPSRYDLDIEIVTPDISAVAVEGGGEIETADGFDASELSLAVNGGGSLDVRSVPANNVSAAINGGGEISLRAENSLSAAVHGGGEITYWGNPAVSKAVAGGGEVSRGS